MTNKTEFNKTEFNATASDFGVVGNTIGFTQALLTLMYAIVNFLFTTVRLIVYDYVFFTCIGVTVIVCSCFVIQALKHLVETDKYFRIVVQIVGHVLVTTVHIKKHFEELYNAGNVGYSHFCTLGLNLFFGVAKLVIVFICMVFFPIFLVACVGRYTILYIGSKFSPDVKLPNERGSLKLSDECKELFGGFFGVEKPADDKSGSGTVNNTAPATAGGKPAPATAGGKPASATAGGRPAQGARPQQSGGNTASIQKSGKETKKRTESNEIHADEQDSSAGHVETAPVTPSTSSDDASDSQITQTAVATQPDLITVFFTDPVDGSQVKITGAKHEMPGLIFEMTKYAKANNGDKVATTASVTDSSKSHP